MDNSLGLPLQCVFSLREFLVFKDRLFLMDVAGGHKLRTRSCLKGFFCSQIRQHMRRHKHIGPKRWHHKENDEHDEDVEQGEHGEHGDAKRDQNMTSLKRSYYNHILLGHQQPSGLPSKIWNPSP